MPECADLRAIGFLRIGSSLGFVCRDGLWWLVVVVLEDVVVFDSLLYVSQSFLKKLPSARHSFLPSANFPKLQNNSIHSRKSMHSHLHTKTNRGSLKRDSFV